ncbi:RNA polymerase sigma factor [Streptomyces sp. WAC04189]|nr:RNA polymerase sigma factor [Streptomyces sp. CS207]QCB27099.1 RNA polymerase sigma factor [Streptomyces sp. SS52]QCR49182.1 RNA polymerase sigma factor [Streptomyces sp. SGAir0924]RIH60666.1 RNA polymerase sigma factor [Streptomyces sp. SHP22-7]RSS06494.1 RNA polymerase sigma factor [Streptomyces sp. WAC04189]RSS14753.1 RNA polymerase sigma factor [Streptomyces sp. WAC05458]RSS22796.1 RNA polymerase sigma factor [Streptomyces sp. WAC08452]RSS69320.1 RNA polymerase sigma factor [Streptomy
MTVGAGSAERARTRYGLGRFLGQRGEPGRVQAYDGELGAAVARAQEGDETAFAIAYRLVQPGLLGYLRGLVGNDAEDVASDAWLEIARDLRRFRGDGAGFRGWTATIARHRALDHLRRQKTRPRPAALEQDLLDLPGPHSTHDQALETLSTEAALALVRGLPRDQAEAVLLRVVVGLDGPAAARVLGKRPGAVRTATYRGLKRLARQLGVDGVTDDAPRTLGEST